MQWTRDPERWRWRFAFVPVSRTTRCFTTGTLTKKTYWLEWYQIKKQNDDPLYIRRRFKDEMDAEL